MVCRLAFGRAYMSIGNSTQPRTTNSISPLAVDPQNYVLCQLLGTVNPENLPKHLLNPYTPKPLKPQTLPCQGISVPESSFRPCSTFPLAHWRANPCHFGSISMCCILEGPKAPSDSGYVPRGSYSTPSLGRLLFMITDPNHKTRYPKRGRV